MRHGRQSRLAEVGIAGQQRIAHARVALSCDGLAGLVEARYLAGAGVLELSGFEEVLAEARRVDVHVRSRDGAHPLFVGAGAPGPARAEVDALDPAPREVARGALAALTALKRVLAGGET
jgi:hypothetical protein